MHEWITPPLFPAAPRAAARRTGLALGCCCCCCYSATRLPLLLSERVHSNTRDGPAAARTPAEGDDLARGLACACVAQPARATSCALRPARRSRACPPPPSAVGGRRCSGTGAWLWQSSQEHPSVAVVARARLLALGIRRFCVDRWALAWTGA
eukprot:COSAG02_NODE_1468_length_12478_cov_50.855481_10_plen_153_part_00